MPVENPDIPDDGVRVSVLGYHDFSETEAETEMKIRTSKFRLQMETLRKLDLAVVSLPDFIAWKNGEKEIPSKSVLLTFDDGWKSFHTDAYPILKEFGYPFTIFLYKNYVDGGGRALTTPMIKELLANGGTIGSHSVSHPYPITIKSYRKKGPEALDKFLRKEMGESKAFLEEKFGVPITTFSYPGGYVTGEMIPLGREFGYEMSFTVQPGKVKRSLPNELLPRYMILGTHDRVFEYAVNFLDPAAAAQQTQALETEAERPPYPVVPDAGAIINSRLPLIRADLSDVPDLDPASLEMRVAGFGAVPAVFDPETKSYSWQVNRRLRKPSCEVKVTWKTTKPEADQPEPLRWSFRIDRSAAYLPDDE